VVASCGDEDLTFSTVLAADELLANGLLHSNGDCTILAWLDCGPPASVRVEVSDTSPRRPEMGPEGRSYGLRIVDGLASRWGTEPARDGKVVWFEVGQPFGRE
jgi:hypothetical protein